MPSGLLEKEQVLDYASHKRMRLGLYVVGLVGIVSLVLSAIALDESLSKENGSQTLPPPSSQDPSTNIFRARFAIPAQGYLTEGVAWDPIAKHFLFGSIAKGGISALIPLADQRSHSIQSMFYLGMQNTGSIGIYVDTANTRYNLWSTLTPYPPGPGNLFQGGIFYRNMITGQQFITDVSNLRNDPVNDTMLINDIVADEEGNVYVTNSNDGMILKGVLSADNTRLDVSVFFNNKTFDYSDVPPSFFGFNGIEYVAGLLIVGISQPESQGGGLVRIDTRNPTDPQRIKVISGVIDEIDGMRFNPSKSLLYVVKGNNLVIAASDDNWRSVRILKEIPSPPDCETPLTTLADIPEEPAIYGMCGNRFTVGPYSIVRLQ